MFEAVTSVSSYINEFTLSHCSQKIAVSLYHYNRQNKETIQEKQCKKSILLQRIFEPRNKIRDLNVTTVGNVGIFRQVVSTRNIRENGPNIPTRGIKLLTSMQCPCYRGYKGTGLLMSLLKVNQIH